MSDHDDVGRPAEPDSRVSARLVALLVLALLVLLLVLDNRRSVPVGYLFGDKQVPMVWVILASVAAGAVLDRLGSWLLRRRRRRRDERR